MKPDEIRDKLKYKIFNLYDLPEDTKVYHLKYSENFTYLLQSEKEKKKYVLRVNRPGYHKREELEGELLWMRKLHEDTDIELADVLQGRDGQYLQKLVFGEESSEYICTMFSFLEGENIHRDNPEELLYFQKEIGKICAKLHLQSMSWKESRNLTRFSWDYEDLFGANCRWGDWSKSKELTEEWKDVIRHAVAIIKKRLEAYGKDENVFGLIHSDFNLNNILVEGNRVKILDFDDCGFGWYMYDFGSAMLEYDENLREMAGAWLEGYESIRKVSQKDKDELFTFIIARKIICIGWFASHSDNDTVKRFTSSFYKKTMVLINQYVEKNKSWIC